MINESYADDFITNPSQDPTLALSMIHDIELSRVLQQNYIDGS